MCSAAFTCGEIAPSSLSCNAAVVESTRPKSTTNFLQKEKARKNKFYVPQHCKCCGAGVGIDKAMKLYGRSIANAAKLRKNKFYVQQHCECSEAGNR